MPEPDLDPDDMPPAVRGFVTGWLFANGIVNATEEEFNVAVEALRRYRDLTRDSEGRLQ